MNYFLDGGADEITLLHHNRWLADTNTSGNSTTITNQNDAVVLRNTFIVYGSLLGGMFLTFCYVRRAFPLPYQLREWVPPIKTSIAKEQYGFFSWIWQLNTVTDDEILLECGMDSLCVLRLLHMGYKICLLSVFNAIWLMPLYATCPTDQKTMDITDPIVTLTIAHVADGSKRLLGTVLAAYLLFGYVMYLILQEFDWFIEKRHKHLKKAVAENYAVYVRNIPSEYRSNTALRDYFANCFSGATVLEAKLRIKAPTLAKAVKKRNETVEKLQHALYYEAVKGKAPMHQKKLLRGKPIPSIPFFVKELHDANREVTALIEGIERNTMGRLSGSERPLDHEPATKMIHGTCVVLDGDDPSELYVDALEQTTVTANEGSTSDQPANDSDNNDDDNEDSERHSQNHIVNQTVNLLAARTLTVAKSVTKIIPQTQEGDFYAAGFVTFSSLGYRQAALQMVHHAKPFDIEVVEAPRPDDVFWSNVGRTHKNLQAGQLASFAATAALCLLWTIPMTFIASLSSVEALSAEIKPLGELIEKYPFLGKLFEILAPLLIKVVNGLLPTILTFLTLLEGPVSSSVVVASLFTKLATFAIVQTFFVSAVGSSLLQEIGNILENPSLIIDILAVSLPSQSTYFIQIVFVSTVFSTGLEILRVTPLAMALIRRFLPPNLTEKERQTTVFGIRPLADPDEFGHADNLSQIVLNFIVMLVYAVIAPLTVFIQAFCFLFMMICYKHQFVYIYPNHPDSGGKIWTNFVSVLLPCLLIAQFTILGMLALQKSVLATPMMVPLICITVLFNAYVRQQHFRVAEFLPSRECMKVDLCNGRDFDWSFTKDAYLQDELREKVKYPEDLTNERASELGLFDPEMEGAQSREYGSLLN